ncbi:CKLF-like MARVEL transmembrane domain-containing protein 8 isoform X2 [Macaca mulatta]
MPAAPDPPRWKETGHWRPQARARRGLTEAKAGRGAEDGQEDPCALSSAPPAGLPTQPPGCDAAPSRPLGVGQQGPCAAREPAHRGARGAAHSRDTRRAWTAPGGRPLAPSAPRRPRSPPPRLCPRGAGPRVQPQTRRGSPGTRQPGSGSTMEDPQRARSHTVTTTASSFAENFSTSSSSFAYDREFLRTLPGLLIVAEIVLGLLVWTLIAGTEYFRVPAFGWVMFVAVFYWVLTVFFLIVYITMTYTRIPQVPWTTVGLCFNGSAFVLYLSAAVVDASSVSPERDSHNFNSWAASS